MVKGTNRAIELKGEETNKAINEIEDLMKHATNFELRLLEPSGEIANPKNTSQFRLRINPVSKRLYLNKHVHIAYRKPLVFTDSNNEFDLEADIFDMMSTYKLNALSIE